MNKILLILLGVMMASCVIGKDKKEAAAPEGYKLVWADEFDKDGKPNPENWTYEKGFKRNNELQWYQEKNASVKDGKLIIEGRREKKKNPNYDPKAKHWGTKREFIEYTSSSLKTQGLQSWQYGIFEVKAKIQAKGGLWPAIWFLGIEGEWPSCGEIDLMEYYKGNILANACWGTKKRWRPKWDGGKKSVKSFGDPKWDDKFHIWKMIWDEGNIKLYIDDILLNTIELKKTVNQDLKKGPKNPFKQPHYMLLNLAIGGNAGGDPSKTEFPTKYEIDYVRVYQKK